MASRYTQKHKENGNASFVLIRNHHVAEDSCYLETPWQSHEAPAAKETEYTKYKEAEKVKDGEQSRANLGIHSYAEGSAG